LNQARVVFKLPEVPISDSEVDTDELVGDRYLLRSVPELEPFGPALPRAVHFVGALLGDVPPRSDLEEYLSNARREGRPVIYLHQSPTFTKGSFIDVVRPFIERRRLGAIIEIANADAKIYEFPRGAFVGRDVPLAQAAAGACAMVATGHPSSVLGALTNGIPMLLFPAGSGTEDMAARCELGGCARVSATETLTERAIDELLSWVLDDPGAKEAAERLRRAFSRYDSVRLGTELTEELFDCSSASYRDSPRGLG
jgi:UDP:flavonoid glycosyltransferase YjiC (YdhE family)